MRKIKHNEFIFGDSYYSYHNREEYRMLNKDKLKKDSKTELAKKKAKIPKSTSKSKSTKKYNQTDEYRRIDIKSYVEMALQNRDKYNDDLRNTSKNRLSRKSNRNNSSSSMKNYSKNKNAKYEYQHLKKYETSEMGNEKFNPQKTKVKPFEPLFSKYEQLDHKRYSQVNSNNENLFKNKREIFPSVVDIGVSSYSIKRKHHILRSSDMNNNNSGINDYRKTFSQPKTKKLDLNDQLDKGLSEIELQERKNFNENMKQKFAGISSIEKSILSKKKLNEEEINQLIFCFIDVLYKEADKILKNKEYIVFYTDGINRIVNMVIVMDNIDQIKIMEALKRTADSYNKMELYEKVSSEIEKCNKSRKSKRYSHENVPNNKEGYSYSNRAKFSKSLNKSSK